MCSGPAAALVSIFWCRLRLPRSLGGAVVTDAVKFVLFPGIRRLLPLQARSFEKLRVSTSFFKFPRGGPDHARTINEPVSPTVFIIRSSRASAMRTRFLTVEVAGLRIVFAGFFRRCGDFCCGFDFARLPKFPLPPADLRPKTSASSGVEGSKFPRCGPAGNRCPVRMSTSLAHCR